MSLSIIFSADNELCLFANVTDPLFRHKFEQMCEAKNLVPTIIVDKGRGVKAAVEFAELKEMFASYDGPIATVAVNVVELWEMAVLNLGSKDLRFVNPHAVINLPENITHVDDITRIIEEDPAGSSSNGVSIGVHRVDADFLTGLGIVDHVRLPKIHVHKPIIPSLVYAEGDGYVHFHVAAATDTGADTDTDSDDDDDDDDDGSYYCDHDQAEHDDVEIEALEAEDELEWTSGDEEVACGGGDDRKMIKRAKRAAKRRLAKRLAKEAALYAAANISDDGDVYSVSDGDGDGDQAFACMEPELKKSRTH
jgi:hypothetical protein